MASVLRRTWRLDMITITEIYQAVDANNSNKVVKFSGRIDSDTLLNQKRKEHPDEFYRDIGKLLIDQFNNDKNWI